MADIDPNVNKEIMLKRMALKKMEMETQLVRMELRRLEAEEEVRKIDRDMASIKEDLVEHIKQIEAIQKGGYNG